MVVGSASMDVMNGGGEVDPARVRTVLAGADAVGGFFAVSTRAAESADPSWRPWEALFEGADGGGLLDARLDEVAANLGAPRRVAASLLGQSLASRPVSILLAAAVDGVLPRVELCWRPWPGGPLPLWTDPDALTATALGAPDDPATGAAVASELAGTYLEPLVAGLRARESVSARVLWGNATAALAGAARVLGTERPAAREAAYDLVRGLLAHPPFAGLGEVVTDRRHPSGLGFARATCCLYYRVPGGGTCGDCVLNRSAARPPAAGPRR